MCLIIGRVQLLSNAFGVIQKSKAIRTSTDHVCVLCAFLRRQQSIVRKGAAEEGLAGEGGVEAEDCKAERDDQAEYEIRRVPR